MILNLGDYKVTTDNMCFILSERKVYGTGEDVKEENRGKEYYSNVGYFPNLQLALERINKDIMLKNDDITDIIDKVMNMTYIIERQSKAIKELCENFKIKA